MTVHVYRSSIQAIGQVTQVQRSWLTADTFGPTALIQVYASELEAIVSAGQVVQVYQSLLAASGNPPVITDVVLSSDFVHPGEQVEVTAVVTGSYDFVTFALTSESLPTTLSDTGPLTRSFTAPYNAEGGAVIFQVDAVNEALGNATPVMVSVQVLPHLDWYLDEASGTWQPNKSDRVV